MSAYPAGAAARDRFILDRRPARATHDPWQTQGAIVEDERAADGAIVRVATVFLTGRECPWRCLMCDLWKYTTEGDTPRGAIPQQIAGARRTLADTAQTVDQIKLYNAGSFFDPRAVPEDDYGAIAETLAGCSRVIVESHPSLVGHRTSRFLDALRQAHPSDVALEVAMGLETVHPEALAQLNKRMDVDDFVRASERLKALGVALRVFLLVFPPFVPDSEQDEWLLRSVDVAFDAGATAVSLIPTRSGNGALEALERNQFRQPRLADLERSFDAGLGRVPPGRGRLFADLWDLEAFADCRACRDARRNRLREMNLRQQRLPAITCAVCSTPPGPARPS